MIHNQIHNQLSAQIRKEIRALFDREVVPAIGCTEPIAVALCVARATELLGFTPAKINASLSGNIIKNAMGVGIPGTGMTGLPIAIALGAIVGRSVYGLEVLRDVDDDAVAGARKMIAAGGIKITLKDDAPDKLYIDVTASCGNDSATAIICGGHTDFVYLARNGEVLLDRRKKSAADEATTETYLTLRRVYDYANSTPIEELEFILESARLNDGAAQEAMRQPYGHALGQIFLTDAAKKLIGDSTFSHILAYTSGACDARMGGAVVPVMSNSGSGNQGISATMPVVVYARENGASDEMLIRALALSHLTVIYIKQKLGRLSALCGCVVAATGSSCGITYLMGGDFRQISYAVKNMVANLTGMICDGAKPSCSLKVTSGVSTAVYSAMMAMNDTTVSTLEGIVDNDVDVTIDNLTRIGIHAMDHADSEILDIMLSKQHS